MRGKVTRRVGIAPSDFVICVTDTNGRPRREIREIGSIFLFPKIAKKAEKGLFILKKTCFDPKTGQNGQFQENQLLPI
jgi:hypothetical protein